MTAPTRLTTISLQIGRSRTYLHTLKLTNPLDYKEMLKLGNGDIAKGYFTFNKIKTETVNKCIEYYYEIDEAGRGLEFSKFLRKKGMFKTDDYFEKRGHMMLFSQRIKRTDFEKIKKIKRYYEEFRSSL